MSVQLWVLQILPDVVYSTMYVAMTVHALALCGNHCLFIVCKANLFKSKFHLVSVDISVACTYISSSAEMTLVFCHVTDTVKVLQLCLHSMLVGTAGPSCQDEPAEIPAVQVVQGEQGEAGNHPPGQGGTVRSR